MSHCQLPARITAVCYLPPRQLTNPLKFEPAHGCSFRKCTLLRRIRTDLTHTPLCRSLVTRCSADKYAAPQPVDAVGGVSSSHPDPQAAWDETSTRLVNSSVLPFIFLLMPQVLKNTLNVLDGNAAALAALSWVGYSMALAGNTLLLTYFVSKRERSAVLIQALGVASNFVLLSQIRLAGFMPVAAYGAVAAAVAAAAVMNSAKLTGLLDRLSAGEGLWDLWSEVLGLVGLLILPQALWNTFATVQSSLPTAAAAGCASALFLAKRFGRLPRVLQPLSGNLLGWTATLLFMFQPLAQLMRNFAVPGSLAGVSISTVLLATTGNALMVPRALITNDLIWFLGSAWGSLFGWAQLLSLYLARTATGEVYIHPVTFAGVTAAMAAYIWFVLSADARHKRVAFPLGPLRGILSGSHLASNWFQVV